MTLVSSKEFIADEAKYFDLALNGGVCIQRGDFVFHLVSQNVNDRKIYHPACVYEKVLEPDDDLRSAITGEELLTGIYEDLEKFFADK